jgi:catechol 2,3-dioxygenase-like lactoylglutathione lyase family enzyme
MGLQAYGRATEVSMGELAAYLRGVALFIVGIIIGTVIMRSSAAQENRSAGLRLNHVGIAVKDFQESLNFYTKVMGFRVAYAFPSPDGKPTTTFLQINRDTFIEMAPASENLPAGITHIGIWSEEANATVAQLKQAGGTLTEVRPSVQTGSRLSNITDPNGIRLELNEQPAGSLMRKALEAWN